MADRRIVIFARLTLTALRSALLVGFPTMTEIFGRFDNRPHSLKMITLLHSQIFTIVNKILFHECLVCHNDDVSEVVVGNVGGPEGHH